MDVQQSVTPPYPGVSIHNEGDSSDDVIKTSPGIMCCRTKAVYEGTVSSRAEQLHSGLCRVLNGEKSCLLKQRSGKKQILFCSSWLTVQGYVSFYTPLHTTFSFNLREKTALQRQANRKLNECSSRNNAAWELPVWHDGVKNKNCLFINSPHSHQLVACARNVSQTCSTWPEPEQNQFFFHFVQDKGVEKMSLRSFRKKSCFQKF